MKLILLSLVIVINLYAGIFDFFSKKENSTTINRTEVNVNYQQKINKLRTFEQNIDVQINEDLKSLNGYLENEVMKNFNTDSSIMNNFEQCYKREKTNLIRGNIGTRIYTIKCWKSFQKDYYSIFNENYINKLINNIDIFLTKKYNATIVKKANILNINPSQHQKKQLYYSLDTIPNSKREYINAISNINNLWNDVIKNINTYDQSFGWLDNMKLVYLETLLTPGDTTREQAIKDYKQALQSIFNINHTFLRTLTADIKDKYKEDIKTQLSDMYMEEE